MKFNTHEEVIRFQKEFRNELKEVRLKVRLSNKEKGKEMGEFKHSLTIDNGTAKIVSKASLRYPYLYIYPFSYSDLYYGFDNPSYISQKALEYWIKVAEIVGVKMIILNEPRDNRNMSEKAIIEIENLIQDKMFDLIEDKHNINYDGGWVLKAETGTRVKKKYVLSLEPGFAEKMVIFGNGLLEAIHSEFEKDITAYINNYRNGNENCLLSIPFYYKGSDGQLDMAIEKDKVIIQETEVEFFLEVKHVEDIKMAVREIFTIIEEKSKLKNLINPPRKHIDTLLDDYLRLYVKYNEKNEVHEEIYEFLVGKNSSETVEEWAACNRERKHLKHDDILLFTMMDFIFVVKSKNEYYTYSTSEKEEAYNKYEDLILETYYKSKIREKIARFDKSLQGPQI